MKVAIVGSTGYDPANAIFKLVQNTSGTILTRETVHYGVDALVSGFCHLLGREVIQYKTQGPSRGGAFMRDLLLIKDADKIIAIFAPDRVMEGGTGHIVNKALDERKEVEAYTIDDAGELVLVGGNNPRTDAGT